MKTTIKLLTMLLFAGLFSACRSDDSPMEGNNHHRHAIYTMKLRLSGISVEDSDIPLTRAFLNSAPASQYVGINVLSRESNNGSYSKYAYGVFDNLDAIYINLYSDVQYKFEVTVIQNATDLLQLEGGNFSHPFRRPSNLQYYLADVNDFKYSTSDYLAYINAGTAFCVSELDIRENKIQQSYMYPRMHRFYGTAEGFSVSSDENQVVNVDMQYQCFGIRINAASLPEGSTLTWQETGYTDGNRQKYLRFDSDAKFVYDSSKNDADGYTWEEIYSLNSFSSSTKKTTLKFTLTRADGTNVTFEKQITLTRGLKKVLNVVNDGNNDVSGSRIVITALDTSLSEESPENVSF